MPTFRHSCAETDQNRRLSRTRCRAVLTPQLASVITPRLQMGRVAAQELLDRIHGIPQQSPIINLGYQIHLGESV